MTRRMCVIAALTLPLAVATLVTMLIAAGELAGAAPFARLVPRNSAEAAGMGYAADVIRLLESGEDPTRVQPLRPEVISSSVTRATTVEAAVWSRQLELVQVLEERGAITPAERPALACLADDLDADDVADYLWPAGVDGCEPGAAVEAVEARSPAHGN
jgi:hypothetical protein